MQGIYTEPPPHPYEGGSQIDRYVHSHHDINNYTKGRTTDRKRRRLTLPFIYTVHTVVHACLPKPAVANSNTIEVVKLNGTCAVLKLQPIQHH